MQSPAKVRIVEVGPRDGLQNEKTLVSTSDKLSYIEKLVAAGLSTIETTSFVRSDRIPQMNDSEELFALVKGKFSPDKSQDHLKFPCLVPNQKGLERALKVGVKDVALFTSTSETFNQKNIQMSVEDSFQRMGPLVAGARANGMRMRGYISTAFGCPYEGDIPVEKVKMAMERYLKLGVEELALGDTIGVATPFQVRKVLESLKKDFNLDRLGLHFHDTRGMGVANILVSWEMGISTFDSSSGGLGGCPYARGASGNVATEDLIYLFDSMGVTTSVQMDKLAEASLFILQKLNKESPSKYLKAYQGARSRGK